MSANNQLIIFKNKNGKFVLKHIDLDCGDLKDKFPEFISLEEAVKEANKFMERCIEDGYEVEYGLDIRI